MIFHSVNLLDQEARALGSACGISRFILKPFDAQQALATIQEALKSDHSKPPETLPPGAKRDPIPLLLNAYFVKGKKLDASVQLASLVEARNVELDESYKEQHPAIIPGRYVVLAVTDTGCGMDRETQARIFDPFFTTKGLGQGTGLGLATVYGIVKQGGGYIWVYSEVEKGSVFKVYLPRVDQSAQLPKREDEQELCNGSEVILLAEDSDPLRAMAHEYLESVGYTVLEAVSGKDALQRAKDFAGTIHVLLTDVVMPEMSGPELARQLTLHRPGIKVIFTSGYTDDAIARQGILDSTVAFVQKPYRPKALARKIREVLRVG